MIDQQLEDRKQDCAWDLRETLSPLLFRYGPIVLREQIWRWLEQAPRNRKEMK